MKEQIEHIVKTELQDLIINLHRCFHKRCRHKQYNFLLGNFNNYDKANMVFVSCFESQIGNRIENICREIAKLRYGSNNVPQKIPNINTEFNLNTCKQYILSDIDYKVATTEVYRKLDPNNKYNAQKIKNLHKDIKIGHKDNINLPVDLAFYDENNVLNIFEIKAGGMLDSSKAKSDIAKLLGLYLATDNINTHVYFATIYNFNGEGCRWDGSPSRFLDEDVLLIGKNFWDKILPQGITFEDFVQIYNKCFSELKIDEEMNNLIENSR